MDTTFLLIGDIHPFLLTNLLRIFIHLAQPKPKPKSKEDEEAEEHFNFNFLHTIYGGFFKEANWVTGFIRRG